MTGTVLTRAAVTARVVAPVMVTLLMTMLAAIPIGIPNSLAIEPMVALLPVYYWSVYRPDLMPIGAAFLIGLFVDLLIAAPMGLSAALLAVVQWVTAGQHKVLVGKGFWVVWLGYVVISAGALLLYWVAYCIFVQQAVNPLPLVLGYLLGLVAYPALSHMFGRLHQRLLQV
jgi:rod shape-determining protein MreD